MYMIGTNSSDFLSIQTKTYTDSETLSVKQKITNVWYECPLNEASKFTDFHRTLDILKELKERRHEITFRNNNVIANLLEKEEGFKFNPDELRIYRLVPEEVFN